MGKLIFILNVFLPTTGTLLSVFVDSNPDTLHAGSVSFNFFAFLVFLLQVAFLPVLFVGWIWGIWHGLGIMINNRVRKYRYRARIE